MKQTKEPYIIALLSRVPSSSTSVQRRCHLWSLSRHSADRCRVINDNTAVLSPYHAHHWRSRANRPQQPICHADDDW